MKHKVKLIQHTPIIHFKPDDIPIRATELKPAFDKFLAKTYNLDIEKFKKDNPYKIRIYYSNKKEKDFEKNMLFFGNLGNDEKDKKFVFADVEVEFFSYKKDVLDKIKDNFAKFLFQYNFATRKSKGFGSFTADENIYLPKNKKVFSFEVDSKNWEKSLGYFYKLLRQGINQPINKKNSQPFYVKPLIFQYACKKRINWEKKRIKECLNRMHINSRSSNPVNSCNGNYNIIRDVFGLSSSQTWMTYNQAKINKKGPFDRFPSPLFFKPIKRNNKMKIYFWIEDFAKEIFDKEFSISIKINKKENYCATLPVMEIDWNEFFDEYILKKDSFINDKNHWIYKNFLSFNIKVEQ